MTRPVYPFKVRHRDVWKIALPATFAFITEPLAGIVDITVIGRLGDAGLLGGLVLGALAFDVIFSLAFFLRLGTAGLVAQNVGARDPLEGLVHFARAMILGVLIGLALLLLTWPIKWITITTLAPEPEIVVALTTYLDVRLWSAPLVLINFALLGWFYGRAAATTGALLQLIVYGSNIVLSILFVYVLGWGVTGVAAGTVIAQLLAALTGLALVVRHYGGLRQIFVAVPFNELKDVVALRRLFGLSRDLMIRSAALMAAFAFFTAQTSRAGAIALAANALLLNLVMVIAYFLDGQAQAAEQLCGKALGANYRPAFDRALKLALGWGLLLGVLLSLALLLCGPLLIDFMTTAPNVRIEAREFLLMASLGAVTGVLPFVMDGVMIGTTQNEVMRNGMLASLACFILSVMILQPIFGINGLWLSLHVLFVSRGIIYWVYMRQRMRIMFPAS